MSPKLAFDYKGYSFFTFSDEGNEPVHVHVCKGRDLAFSDKFWLTDSGWVAVEPIKVISKSDFRKVLNYLVRNKDRIEAGYKHHHSQRTTGIRRMKLD